MFFHQSIQSDFRKIQMISNDNHRPKYFLFREAFFSSLQYTYPELHIVLNPVFLINSMILDSLYVVLGQL